MKPRDHLAQNESMTSINIVGHCAAAGAGSALCPGTITDDRAGGTADEAAANGRGRAILWPAMNLWGVRIVLLQPDSDARLYRMQTRGAHRVRYSDFDAIPWSLYSGLTTASPPSLA
jgi:hypothetical protein